ncbi:hypothetical protein LTR56_003662 [Elasticomyces elasticus]|nr:hypothetical protein LTR22_016889 [Elasticomyces elasticus]KAK3655240.1 hypothetical protein LTR56_003662 [Elasticomyces elasticus]KAK4913519.1 hypothetical protein LTR49_018135 [Elasticomyces elasticus]KAK5767280.1 hypothetical protein LTS12_002432 [Elasticomyces elasticus]
MAGKKGATTADTAKTTKTRVSSVGAVKKATKAANRRTKASNADETSPTQAAQSAASFIEKITGLIVKRFSSVVHSQAVTEFAEFVVIVLQETHRDLFKRQDEEAILQQARKFAGPSGDPGSPTAFITHWMPDHDNDSEEGSDSEEEDSDEEDSDEGEGSEVGGDDDVEVAREVIVLDDDHEQVAAEVIVLDEDDEPPHIPQSTLKRKATAEAAVPIDTPARKKRPAPLKIKGRRYWRAIYPVKRYTDTFDLGYETMRTLKKLFPNLASQVYLYDLYKRKQKIKVDGKRLNGTEPYEALRKCRASTVVLFGGVVKAAFTSEFGEFESGQKMLIGGRLRTVIHFQHPEWIYKYSTSKNLQPLKTRLKDLKKLVAGDLDVSISAINKLIEKKSKTPKAVARAEKRAKSAPKPGPMEIPPTEMTAAAAEYFAACKALGVFMKANKIKVGVNPDLSAVDRQQLKAMQSRLAKAAFAAKMGIGSEAASRANRKHVERRMAEGTGIFSAEAKAKSIAKNRAPETMARRKSTKLAAQKRKWEERLEACKGDPVASVEVEKDYHKYLLQKAANARRRAKKEAAAQHVTNEEVEDEEKREANDLSLGKLAAEKKAAKEKTAKKKADKEKADKEEPDKKTVKSKLEAESQLYVKSKLEARSQLYAKSAITQAANIERKWTEKKEACKGDPVESAKVEKAYQKSLQVKVWNKSAKIKKVAKAANKQTPVEEGEEEVEDVVDEDGGFEEDS